MVEPRWLRTLEGPSLTIVEDRPFLSILRLHNVSEAGVRNLGLALQLDWPSALSTLAGNGEVEVCCVGPHEWVVIGLAHEALCDRLNGALDGTLHHVADMSGAWTRWRIRGGEAPSLLAKGCSLDLSAMRAGQDCARTLLGQFNVLLERHHAEWALYAERALSDQVWAWLERAGQEFAG
jgi:heterotetrameric sarcosine oxidase gamma subunit